jgi:hypothetical protein
MVGMMVLTALQRAELMVEKVELSVGSMVVLRASG